MGGSPSFQAAAWRRLKKNKGAMFGIVIIILAVILAIFAYFIAPDHSPYANRIILEIDGSKPGLKQDFVLIKKERSVSSASFINKLISGQEDAYYYVPITSHSIKGDSIIVEKFIDEGVSERLAYPLS